MLFAIIASLALIGFFSGYEIGFVSANRLSLELKKKQGGQSGKIIAKFLAEPTQFIGTCLVGLNISLVVFGILFEANCGKQRGVRLIKGPRGEIYCPWPWRRPNP